MINEYVENRSKTLFNIRKSMLGKRGSQVSDAPTCLLRHETHHLVGDAYVHDMMDGEAVLSGHSPVSIFLA